MKIKRALILSWGSKETRIIDKVIEQQAFYLVCMQPARHAYCACCVTSPLAGASANTKFLPQFSALKTELPAQVNLLTLEPWKDGTILLRLEHILEKTEVPKDSNEAVQVELKVRSFLFAN
jgi:hypothetical protein